MEVNRNATAYIVCLLLVTFSDGEESADMWENQVTLDEMYQLYWRIDGDVITFQVEVATKGWVGFGLSLSGSVSRSDIVIGWVEGETGHLYDYFAKAAATLNIDKDNNWKLLFGNENKTHTILKFSRRLDTCDAQDIAIGNNSLHVIYAQFPKDPESPRNVNFRQTMWMMIPLKLLRPRFKKVPMSNDISYWDVRAQNFTIPSDNPTYYLCQVFKSPLITKHHVIKITTLIRPQNIANVHHVLLFKCPPGSTEEAEIGLKFGPTQCYLPTNPPIFNQCTRFYAAWGVGGGPFVYPIHAGASIGEGQEYFVLSVHYDNPTFIPGLVDDSGMRLYYTTQLRPNDAALSVIATSLNFPITNVFPPGQRDFVVHAHIHPQCLAQGMPADGINIFAVFLHSHHLGKRIKFRHFRKNKELPPIAIDLTYINHFQEYIFFPRDLKVLPGDQLTVECTYDTRGYPVAMFNGLGTDGEMCGGFFYYYPPLPVIDAESSPPVEIIAALTGMNLTERDYTKVVIHGEPNPNYVDYLIDYNWPQSQMCLVQNAMRYSPQTAYCLTDQNTVLPVPKPTYPDNLKPYRFPATCKGQNQEQGGAMSSMCPDL